MSCRFGVVIACVLALAACSKKSDKPAEADKTGSATAEAKPAEPAAADRDAEEGWLQALTLHRRQGTLHKELREAEAALAGEASDPNLARLVDIQNQLARSEGTEALIEGFGASSGRQARVF